MPCFHPIDSYQDGSRRVFFGKVVRGDVYRTLRLPCGQCIGCRLRRSAQWAIRCVHESRMHDWSSYITLTYDDEHVPHDGSLCHRDFQLFMKRFRKDFNVRYYMCGEYGEENGRPHFHAIIFGHFFRDRVFYKYSPSGAALYTSKELARYWTSGFSSVGDCTFESAAYVARYVMKKVNGDMAFEHYKRVTADGEVIWLKPEYTHMSLRPYGIGASWFAKYGSQVYPRDECIVGGRKMVPPRYYDQLLNRYDPEMSDFMLIAREKRALQFVDDNTLERLADREKVAAAGMSFKLRSKV